MESLIELLTWISLGSGGLLIFFLLLSIVGGLDFDFGDTDADSGGLGIFKSLLTFMSVASWVVKAILVASENKALAVISGLVAGILAVLLLTLLLRTLLKLQKDTTWSPNMSVGKRAKVYLKIPESGSGIITVKINGSNRELKAISIDNIIINTGEQVLIHEYKNGFASVSLFNEN